MYKTSEEWAEFFRTHARAEREINNMCSLRTIALDSFCDEIYEFIEAKFHKQEAAIGISCDWKAALEPFIERKMVYHGGTFMTIDKRDLHRGLSQSWKISMSQDDNQMLNLCLNTGGYIDGFEIMWKLTEDFNVTSRAPIDPVIPDYELCCELSNELKTIQPQMADAYKEVSIEFLVICKQVELIEHMLNSGLEDQADIFVTPKVGNEFYEILGCVNVFGRDLYLPRKIYGSKELDGKKIREYKQNVKQLLSVAAYWKEN